MHFITLPFIFDSVGLCIARIIARFIEDSCSTSWESLLTLRITSTGHFRVTMFEHNFRKECYEVYIYFVVMFPHHIQTPLEFP